MRRKPRTRKLTKQQRVKQLRGLAQKGQWIRQVSSQQHNSLKKEVQEKLSAAERIKIPPSVLATVNPVAAGLRNLYSPGCIPTDPLHEDHLGEFDAFREAVVAAARQSTNSQQLKDALIELVNARSIVEGVISARQSQSGSRPRQDALNKILRQILESNPQMGEKEVREKLEAKVEAEPDRPLDCDEDYIYWNNGAGKTVSTPWSALKDRISRIKKTLRTPSVSPVQSPSPATSK